MIRGWAAATMATTPVCSMVMSAVALASARTSVSAHAASRERQTRRRPARGRTWLEGRVLHEAQGVERKELEVAGQQERSRSLRLRGAHGAEALKQLRTRRARAWLSAGRAQAGR